MMVKWDDWGAFFGHFSFPLHFVSVCPVLRMAEEYKPPKWIVH